MSEENWTGYGEVVTYPVSKWCSKCKETKGPEFFDKNRVAKDGLANWCKQCKRQARDKKLLSQGKKLRPRVIVPEGYKYCPKCKEIKILGQYTGKKKPSPYCRDCMYAINIAWRRAKGDKEKKKRTPGLIEQGVKECMECLKALPMSDFSPSSRGIAGRSAYCKPCQNIRAKRRPREEVNAYARQWREGNSTWAAQHRNHQQKRRQVKAQGVSDEYDNAVFTALYDNSHCFYCDLYTPREQRTIDHVVPLCEGGQHIPSNTVMSCGSCNFRKHRSHVWDFIQRFDKDQQNQVAENLFIRCLLYEENNNTVRTDSGLPELSHV